MASLFLTPFLVCLTLICLVRLSVADIMCYACNSYMPQCKQPKLSAANNNVFQARCTTKCFTRQGEDEAIYRGCFDAFKAVKQLTDGYTGCRNQTWNNRVRRWCLCDSDLCNNHGVDDAVKSATGQQPSAVHHRDASRQDSRHVARPHHPETHKSSSSSASSSSSYSATAPAAVAAAADYGAASKWQPAPQPSSALHVEKTQNHVKHLSTSSSQQQQPQQQQQSFGGTVSHNVYPDEWHAKQYPATADSHAKNALTGSEHLEPIGYFLTHEQLLNATAADSTSSSYLDSPFDDILDQVNEFEEMLRSNPEIVEHVDGAAVVEGTDAGRSSYEPVGLETGNDDDDEGDESLDDLVEYPYNQEFGQHASLIADAADFAIPAADEPLSFDPVTVGPERSAKNSELELVDYPYNQGVELIGEPISNDGGGSNSVWKEAMPVEHDKPTHEAELGMVDYPYNQIIGHQDSLLGAVVQHHAHGDGKPDVHAASKQTKTVRHTVHSEQLQQPAPNADQVHQLQNLQHQQQQSSHQHHLAAPSVAHPHQQQHPAANDASKTGQLPLLVEFERKKPVRLAGRSENAAVPHGTAVHGRTPPNDGAPNGGSTHDAQLHKQHVLTADKQATKKNGVGDPRHAKESLDGFGYEQYDDMLPGQQSSSRAGAPTVPLIRCSHTGYYQNPKDCTQFVACLFDHNTRTKVLHLMRCPSGLVWDNLRKLCMESSSTCHPQQQQQHPDTSYMQYFTDSAPYQGLEGAFQIFNNQLP